MSDLRTRILAYVEQVGVKAAGKSLGAPVSVIARWQKGTHSPSLSHAEAFMALADQDATRHLEKVHQNDAQKNSANLPSTPAPKVVVEAPLGVDDNSPILPRRAAQPAQAAPVSRAPQGIAPPQQGDILVDEKISNKLPPTLVAANMSVNPFGGNETPIVGPARASRGRPAQTDVANPSDIPPPIGMPRGRVMSEEAYKKAMEAAHTTPEEAAMQKSQATRAIPPAPLFERHPASGEVLPAQTFTGGSLLNDPAPAVEKPQLHIQQDYTLDQLQQMRQALFNWQGKELAILVPVYKWVNPGTNWVIAALIRDLGDKAWYKQIIGDSVIENSRNKLADFFLKTNTVWSFWIDDDMILPVGRAFEFKELCGLPPEFSDKIAGEHCVHRLMSHRRTFIGGTYFGRHANGRPMFYEGQINHQDHRAARSMEDAIRPATWVATGCLLVHRQVYFDIQRTQPEIAPTAQRPYWDFFKKPDGLGEDVGFSLRATKAGHQPFVDTGLQCGHVGYNVWGAWNTTGGLAI